jgi:hypothetical protein
MSLRIKKIDQVGLEVATSLSSAFADERGTFVTTPLLFPSGSHVVVWFDGTADSYFVSDHGAAQLEADLMGGEQTFSRLASDMAGEAGIGFDENCFFVSGVSRAKLVTAVTVVANISKEAASQTAFRLAEKNYRFDDLQLVERLEKIFGKPRVLGKPELLGASNRRWTFSASVEHEGHRTVFDLVKPTWQSLLPSVAKFADISDLVDAPRRVAVLADKKHTNPADINLLSRAARVIDFSARDEAYQRAA